MTKKSKANRDPAKSAFPSPRLHLRIGWLSLLVFLSLGILLEYLHAVRAAWYLDLGEPEVRRLMWTLAHAHGTLLSLVHLAFGATIYIASFWNSQLRILASCCLTAAGILLPAGFFLGGLYVYDGDPGLGVFLVPPGGLLLLLAVSLTAWGVWKEPADEGTRGG